jgi:hypothetical protein
MASSSGHDLDAQAPGDYTVGVMPVVSDVKPSALPDIKEQAAKRKPAQTPKADKITPPKGYTLVSDIAPDTRSNRVIAPII